MDIDGQPAGHPGGEAASGAGVAVSQHSMALHLPALAVPGDAPRGEAALGLFTPQAPPAGSAAELALRLATGSASEVLPLLQRLCATTSAALVPAEPAPRWPDGTPGRLLDVYRYRPLLHVLARFLDPGGVLPVAAGPPGGRTAAGLWRVSSDTPGIAVVPNFEPIALAHFGTPHAAAAAGYAAAIIQNLVSQPSQLGMEACIALSLEPRVLVTLLRVLTSPDAELAQCAAITLAAASQHIDVTGTRYGQAVAASLTYRDAPSNLHNTPEEAARCVALLAASAKEDASLMLIRALPLLREVCVPVSSAGRVVPRGVAAMLRTVG
jgi:hypothetical protein